ncbi:MAG: hypothetical protein JNJ80_08490 [Gemmatimonadetes bacterium]|nr:hypothetical protein [Gemmatimonadota bacterium]
MPQFAAFLLLGLGLPLIVALAGVSSWTWIVLGAGAWGGGVLLKTLLGGPVGAACQALRPRQSFRSVWWGVWSAVCELGVAALVFAVVTPFPTLGEAIGFGVGAGSLEAFYVLYLAIRATGADGLVDASGRAVAAAPAGPVDRFQEWSGVLERFLASVGHLASRGLVWAGMQAAVLVPGLAFAVATFAAIDGVAFHGSVAKWDWADPGLSRRFYRFVAVVTGLELIAFLAAAGYLCRSVGCSVQ